MVARQWRVLLGSIALGLVLAGRADADEIQLLNGDRLTGTIVSAGVGKLTIKTEAAGDVTVDLAKVKTFTTDAPVVFKVGETTLRGRAVAGPDGTVEIVPDTGEPARVLTLTDVTQINPPAPQWVGALSLNGMITTGNSETTTAGGSFNAVRRSEQDRITLQAGGAYGKQTNQDTDEETVTVNNMFGFAKYDYFLTKKLYLFGAVRAERDVVADLALRFTPSVGLGYQWYETPTFNLNTEAGLAWVYEDFDSGGSSDRFAARLAYHVDWTPHKAVLLFHNLEWLPALDNPINDYNLNGDAGVRTTIYQGFFAEAKVELRYDSRPAPNAAKEDFRYILAIGWSF